MRSIVKNGGWLKVLAIALALANLVFWYTVPWVRDFFDAMTGRSASPLRPKILYSVQELLVYYDPWLALRVFPVVYTLGFIAIAFLFQPTSAPRKPISGSAVLAILLLGFEAVWLFLMTITIFFRGPNWNFYWPWEAWNPKLVPLNTINFSVAFWRYLAGLPAPPTPWVVREIPGLLLAVGYFLLGLLSARLFSRGSGYITTYCCFIFVMLFTLAPLCLRQIAAPGTSDFGVKTLVLLLVTVLILLVSYPIFRLLRQGEPYRVAGSTAAYWRWVLVVLLIQVAALVPVKVLLQLTFDLKYFIYIPEYWVNL